MPDPNIVTTKHNATMPMLPSTSFKGLNAAKSKIVDNDSTITIMLRLPSTLFSRSYTIIGMALMSSGRTMSSSQSQLIKTQRVQNGIDTKSQRPKETDMPD